MAWRSDQMIPYYSIQGPKPAILGDGYVLVVKYFGMLNVRQCKYSCHRTKHFKTIQRISIAVSELPEQIRGSEKGLNPYMIRTRNGVVGRTFRSSGTRIPRHRPSLVLTITSIRLKQFFPRSLTQAMILRHYERAFGLRYWTGNRAE